MPAKSSITEAQFLEAYDLYADAIFRHCALRVGDRELGKDLMQDTFLRAWQTLQNGTVVENIRAFLYTVANHLIIDHARRRKLRPESSLEDMQEETGFDVPDKAPDPKRAFEGTHVLETLQNVEEPYRTALVMHYVDGLPPREIAEALGISANLASVRLHRGLAQLTTLLNPAHE